MGVTADLPELKKSNIWVIETLLIKIIDIYP